MWVVDRKNGQSVLVGNLYDSKGVPLRDLRIYVRSAENGIVRLSIDADERISLERPEKPKNGKFNRGKFGRSSGDLLRPNQCNPDSSRCDEDQEGIER